MNENAIAIEITEPKTLSVPEAGARYFGLSRNASYEAAKRGDIPTIRIGKLLRVPVRAMERMLDEAAQGSS
jgi:Helix-turn-helix domain